MRFLPSHPSVLVLLLRAPSQPMEPLLGKRTLNGGGSSCFEPEISRGEGSPRGGLGVPLCQFEHLSRVDSPFFSPIVLCNNPRVVGVLFGKKDAWKEWGNYP